MFFNALQSHVYPHLFIDALGIARQKEQRIATDYRTRYVRQDVGLGGRCLYLVRLCSRIHAQSLLAFIHTTDAITASHQLLSHLF